MIPAHLTHVIVRDLDGRIRLWSTGAERLYGWSAREATGAITHDLLATEFPKPLPEIDADLLREGVWEGELRHRTRNGGPNTVASRWELQQDQAGNPVAVVEASREVNGASEQEL